MKKIAAFSFLAALLIASLHAGIVHSQQSGTGVGLTIGAFDSDRDGTPDNQDNDDDNDGVDDAEDVLIGNSTFVQSDTVTVNITINGTVVNFSKGFSGAIPVVVNDINITLVNFTWDFSEKPLNLANITIERQEVESKGATLVRGITLTGGRTKTMFVDKVNTSIERLCIKDAHIDKITEISSDCSGSGETAITCPGSAGSYDCTSVDDNTRYKITGLSFTGIIQQAAPSAEEETPSGGGTTGGGGGGGGGAGGGRTPVVARREFTLSKEALKVVLKQGQTAEESIGIKNTGDTALDITTYLQPLKDFIFSPDLDEVKIILEPAEEKTLNLVFGAEEEQQPDIYTGEIKIKSGVLEKIISTIVEVESAKPLFDVDVEVLSQYKSIFPGDEVFIEVSLFNVRGFGRVDVNIEYAIKDFKGNSIAVEEETLAVENQAKFTRELLMPSDIKPGTYIASVKVTFENSVGTSSDLFEVKARSIRLLPIKNYMVYLLLGAAFIIFTGSVFLMYEFGVIRKRAPKTKEEEFKGMQSEEKAQKLQKELEALEQAYKSKFISEESYMKSRERIENELKKFSKQ